MHMLSALRAGARRQPPLRLLAPSARRPAYLNLNLARARAMSSTAPKRQQFLVYAPDKTDEGAFQRRLDVRTQHLANAAPLHDNGSLKYGSALLTPESIASADAAKKMVGSVMVFEMETLEDVKKLIEGDIYYKTGVWDPERIVILPVAAPLPS